MDVGTRSAREQGSTLHGGLAAGAIFLAALTIRYAFVDQLRDHSYLGNIRVSDARTYFLVASQIVEGTAPFEPYWQAPLYPLVLSVFQKIFGNNLHSVQWLQIGIGALNCALVFQLARRLFGERAAWIAGSVAVFYAPFWIFDAQPLPANLTALLDLLAVLAWLRFRDGEGSRWLVAAGALLGAAVITHGLAIFTVPVFVYDLVRSGRLEGRSVRANVALFLVITALAPLAVSVRNTLAAGEPVFISYNAGINLYLGNHRDLDETLGRRGGFEWGEIFRDPYTSGAREPAELNRFFLRRAIEEWTEAPLALCATTLEKILISLAGHEPKRNFPIYPLRDDSWLLRVAMFEVPIGGRTVFAFPAGLVIPFAIFGVAAAFRGRREVGNESTSDVSTGFAAKVAIAHVIGMVIFFPTARYRLPALVLLLPYAAFMVDTLWTRLSREGSESRVDAKAAVLAVLAFLVVNVVATNLFRQPIEDRAAHLYSVARWTNEKLRHVASVSLEARMVANAEAAIAIDPDYPEPVHLLALHYQNRDIDRSVAYFARLVELVPDEADVLRQFREALAIRDGARPQEKQ